MGFLRVGLKEPFQLRELQSGEKYSTLARRPFCISIFCLPYTFFRIFLIIIYYPIFRWLFDLPKD